MEFGGISFEDFLSDEIINDGNYRGKVFSSLVRKFGENFFVKDVFVFSSRVDFFSERNDLFGVGGVMRLRKMIGFFVKCRKSLEINV